MLLNNICFFLMRQKQHVKKKIILQNATETQNVASVFTSVCDQPTNQVGRWTNSLKTWKF